VASVRHDRIQELIKELASNIILFRLKDPRLGFVTITKVDLSPDMRSAKVFYSVLGSDKDVKLTDAAIRHARGHVQREVAKRLHVRFAPEIVFVFDEYPRKSIELSKLIDKALAEDEERRKQTGREEPAEAPAETDSEEPQGEDEADELVDEDGYPDEEDVELDDADEQADDDEK